jgi:hypothetical protein
LIFQPTRGYWLSSTAARDGASHLRNHRCWSVAEWWSADQSKSRR